MYRIVLEKLIQAYGKQSVEIIDRFPYVSEFRRRRTGNLFHANFKVLNLKRRNNLTVYKNL